MAAPVLSSFTGCGQTTSDSTKECGSALSEIAHPTIAFLRASLAGRAGFAVLHDARRSIVSVEYEGRLLMRMRVELLTPALAAHHAAALPLVVETARRLGDGFVVTAMAPEFGLGVIVRPVGGAW